MLPSMTAVEARSTMEECGLPLKSTETSSSSVASRMPCKGPLAAARKASLTAWALAGFSSAAEILVREVVDGLVIGVGMHGGREAPLDAEIVEQHLGHGGEAIGRARGVRDELMTGGIVLLLVDPQDDRDVRILGGRRDHHLLGPGLEVLGRGRLVTEDAGGLDHDVHPELAPGQCRGVLGGAHAHLAAIDEDGLALVGDLGVEDAV